MFETLENQVSVVDQEDGLRIVNYTECSNSSPDDLKKLRGVVQEVETGKDLFETFPYTDEYGCHEEELMSRLGDEEITKDWDVFYSIEGSLIRVFWHVDRWYISTNKKLNAFKSRWSSRKSFGDMFRDGLVAMTGDENVLEVCLEQLDKNLVYLFLVKYNHENRIVCQTEKDQKDAVVFVGMWDEKEKKLDREWKLENIALPVATKVETTLTKSGLQEFVDTIDYKKYQGLILFHKHSNRQIKIYSNNYYELYKVRGNNPNIRFRYLEIRKDPDMKKKFFDLYPIYTDVFLEYENILYQVAKLVRFYYIQRYIKNKYVTLPKEEYILMKKCHDWYLLNRNDNKINVTKVLEILQNEDTLSLYKMIRRYQINQYNMNDATTNNAGMVGACNNNIMIMPDGPDRMEYPQQRYSYPRSTLMPVELDVGAT